MILLALSLLACGPKSSSISRGTAAAGPTLDDCARPDPYSPVTIAPSELGERNWAGVTRVGELQASADRPVEVCGVQEQLDFLMALECADGSNPYTSRDQAHASRVGNVGPGGRCGSIIDLYVMPCPEGQQQIHMDLYVCPG